MRFEFGIQTSWFPQRVGNMFGAYALHAGRRCFNQHDSFCMIVCVAHRCCLFVVLPVFILLDDKLWRRPMPASPACPRPVARNYFGCSTAFAMVLLFGSSRCQTNPFPSAKAFTFSMFIKHILRACFSNRRVCRSCW